MTNEQILSAAAEMLDQENPFMEGLKAGPVTYTLNIMRDGSVERFTQVDLCRRPDGVWEMPG